MPFKTNNLIPNNTISLKPKNEIISTKRKIESTHHSHEASRSQQPSKKTKITAAFQGINPDHTKRTPYINHRLDPIQQASPHSTSTNEKWEPPCENWIPPRTDHTCSENEILSLLNPNYYDHILLRELEMPKDYFVGIANNEGYNLSLISSEEDLPSSGTMNVAIKKDHNGEFSIRIFNESNIPTNYSDLSHKLISTITDKFDNTSSMSDQEFIKYLTLNLGFTSNKAQHNVDLTPEQILQPIRGESPIFNKTPSLSIKTLHLFLNNIQENKLNEILENMDNNNFLRFMFSTAEQSRSDDARVNMCLTEGDFKTVSSNIEGKSKGSFDRQGINDLFNILANLEERIKIEFGELVEVDEDNIRQKELIDKKSEFYSGVIKECVEVLSKDFIDSSHESDENRQFEYAAYRSAGFTLICTINTILLTKLNFRLTATSNQDDITQSWTLITDHVNKAMNDDNITYSIKGQPTRTLPSSLQKSKYNEFSYGNEPSTVSREHVPVQIEKTMMRMSQSEILDFTNKANMDNIKGARFVFRSIIKALSLTFLRGWSTSVKDLEGMLKFINSDELSPADNLERKILTDVTSIAEYPIPQAINSLTALYKQSIRLNQTDETPQADASSNHQVSIFDPCGGWGNRIYAGIALMQEGYVKEYCASDPNMEQNNIKDFIINQIKEGVVTNIDIEGEGHNDKINNVDLLSKTISENLQSAIEDTLNNKLKKYDIMYSCPPYADTQVHENNYSKKNGTRKRKVKDNDSDNVLVEQYNKIKCSNANFVEEFGINLALLAARKLNSNGQLLMQFNREHAQVFAAILSATNMFGNISISKATVKDYKPTKTSTVNWPQVFVYAVRNHLDTGHIPKDLNENISTFRSSQHFEKLVSPQPSSVEPSVNIWIYDKKTKSVGIMPTSSET